MMWTVQVADLHDFFVAAAGVMGALIGLLFVALSVAQERMKTTGVDRFHRVRASAALTAFSNALVVSLFGLIPDVDLGAITVAVGCVGLAFLGGAALFLRHERLSWALARDSAYLVGLAVLFVFELITGVRLSRSVDAGQLQRLAILVVVCAVVGIARAWQLIGAPSITMSEQITDVGREALRKIRGDTDGSD